VAANLPHAVSQSQAELAIVSRLFLCKMTTCQRSKTAIQTTWAVNGWQKVGLDIIHMPPSRGFRYLALARSDSGWVRGATPRQATSEMAARFLWEDIVCRHGVFSKLVADRGPENEDLVGYSTC
jgi:hypothetical protein